MQAILLVGLVLSTAVLRDDAITPDRVVSLFNGTDLSGWQADIPARDSNTNAPDSFIVRKEC